DLGEGSKSDPRDNGQCNLVDHFARMTGDNGGTKNLVGSFFDMDLHESGLFAVGDRAMHVVHRYGKGSHRDVLVACLADVEADVSNLGIGVGAPRNRQRAKPPSTKRQRVMYGDPSRGVGGVGELVLQANIPRGK